MKAVLVVLAVLLALAFPVPVAATVVAVLTVALAVITHPLLILAAELVVLAVIAAGIARAAGFSFPEQLEVLHMRQRREFADLPPGVVKVRLQGDTVGTDVIAHILRDHPAIEVLTGPDRYDGGRQYLLVKVASPAEVLAAIGAAGGEPPARDVTQCLASACPPPKLDNCQWPRCAAPRLLPAPREDGGTQ